MDRTINPFIPSPFGQGGREQIGGFSNLSSTRYAKSAYSVRHLGPSPLPLGGPTFREG
ncbi:hypothetical protein EMIT0232MI5_50257 [Pseudomonas sp. IT-232MI5]